MTRLFAIFVIGLGLGGGFGFLVAAANGVTLDGHDHGAHSHDAAPVTGPVHHHDALLEVHAVDAPDLVVQVTKDPVAGWNLHVITENFRFSPENSGGAHVANQGHAHVYVDGKKVARLYGSWMHFSSLPEEAEVEVTLNSNDHRTLSVNGQAISASVSLSATQ